MRQQALKDQLFRQLESNWAKFLSEVTEMKAQINSKLAEISMIYGPEIVRALLKQSKNDIQFQFNDGTRATPPAPKPTAVKKPVPTKKATPFKKKVRRHRKMKLSLGERKRRAHQVAYLNLLKKFSARGRVKYKHLFKKQGCQAAIDAMKSFLNK